MTGSRSGFWVQAPMFPPHRSATQMLVPSMSTSTALAEPNDANITMRLSELARLSYDMGDYQESADYFGQADEFLEQLSIESSDPIGYERRVGKLDVKLAGG